MTDGVEYTAAYDGNIMHLSSVNMLLHLHSRTFTDTGGDVIVIICLFVVI